MGAPINNKRRDDRMEALIFLEINSAFTGENIGRGVMLDVSRSGFLAETECELTPGETYLCQIEMPLTFKAKVMWRKTPGQVKRIGFQYTDLSFVDKLIFKRFLKGPRRSNRVR